MTSDTGTEKAINVEAEQRQISVQDDNSEEEKHIERVPTPDTNLVYDDQDEEPELHARTYFALAAMFLLNLVQVFALQGPPAVVCYDEIERLNQAKDFYM